VISQISEKWNFTFSRPRRDIHIPGSPERCEERMVVEDHHQRRFVLEKFTLDQIPLGFSHGDFHPINIIWSKDDINGVIDWEFMGWKPEIYDLANLLGCLGMEDPPALVGDLVSSLLHDLEAGKFFCPVGWQSLLDFVIALRFAWLSEWLRKKDPEMIDLELVYLNLLVENHGDITASWNAMLP